MDSTRTSHLNLLSLPVWPLGINPLFDKRASALKLRGVSGQTTELFRLPTEGAHQC